MKNLNQYLPYVIIAGLLAFIFINRSCDFEGGQTRTVETDSASTFTTDSTTIDWDIITKNISAPDTIIKEVPVPYPVEVEPTDSVATRTYDQSYRDSLIHARWTTRVAGKMLGQEFSYVPQVQHIGIKTITKWRTRTLSLTKTIRITEQPGGYMTAGGMVGVWGDHAFVGPVAGWTSARGDHFQVGYDPMNNGVLVSGQIKISFRGLFPF